MTQKKTSRKTESKDWWRRSLPFYFLGVAFWIRARIFCVTGSTKSKRKKKSRTSAGDTIATGQTWNRWHVNWHRHTACHTHTTHLMSPLDITREAIGNIYQNLEVKLEYLFQQKLNLPPPQQKKKKWSSWATEDKFRKPKPFFFILLTWKECFKKKTKRADFSLSIQSRADGWRRMGEISNKTSPVYSVWCEND